MTRRNKADNEALWNSLNTKERNGVNFIMRVRGVKLREAIGILRGEIGQTLRGVKKKEFLKMQSRVSEEMEKQDRLKARDKAYSNLSIPVCLTRSLGRVYECRGIIPCGFRTLKGRPKV